jgi:hypothetical protein
MKKKSVMKRERKMLKKMKMGSNLTGEMSKKLKHKMTIRKKKLSNVTTNQKKVSNKRSRSCSRSKLKHVSRSSTRLSQMRLNYLRSRTKTPTDSLVKTELPFTKRAKVK